VFWASARTDPFQLALEKLAPSAPPALVAAPPVSPHLPLYVSSAHLGWRAEQGSRSIIPSGWRRHFRWFSYAVMGSVAPALSVSTRVFLWVTINPLSAGWAIRHACHSMGVRPGVGACAYDGAQVHSYRTFVGKPKREQDRLLAFALAVNSSL